MEKIKFVVCGAGQRGTSLSRDVLTWFPEIKICGIFDPYIDKAEILAGVINDKIGYFPKVYDSYENMFAETNPDVALVATSWESHVPVSVYAMEKGVAVAMEVGAVYNEEECWALVDTYEKTKTPFFLLENCCYGKDELFATAMARKGEFGEIVYCHGAYRHDLRREVSFGELTRHYRNGEYSKRNRDNYPTHDLGPIAKLLNINRGNRMVSLVSRASKARGLAEYCKKNEEVAYLKDREFVQGDIVETLITCENGELISLRLDTTLPTYYSREFSVRGTKGSYEQNTNMVVLDGKFEEEFDTITFVKNEINNAEKYYDEFLPDNWKAMTEEKMKAGHGGIDILEFESFLDCLKNKKEMPIDVYDAASWMAVSYLSEISIANGGASVEIPDFTRGEYRRRKPKDVTEFGK